MQADVTNLRDLWACRSYVIEQMGGLPPNLVICNSGLTESGYSFGRALKEEEGEPSALRRARVRQHFLDSLDESRLVLDTKVDGFSHLPTFGLGKRCITTNLFSWCMCHLVRPLILVQQFPAMR